MTVAQRPSVALVIGLVISSAIAVLVLVVMLLSGGPLGFGVSMLLAVAPLPVLLAAILSLDRLEPEPRLHLAFAFTWGAGVAILLGIVLTLAGQALFAQAGLGSEAVDNAGTVFLAPVIEEALKGSALLLLLLRRREIDGLTDGIVYAALAGLGFAAVENVGYYLSAYGEAGVGGTVGLFVLRGLIDPLGHSIYTAMTGLGVAYALTRRGALRYTAIPLGYLGAVILHGLWNTTASTGSLPLLGVAYLVIMGVLAALIAVTFVERRQLLARIGRYLPGYQSTGLVTPLDVRMLGTMRDRRRARKWARGAGLGRRMGDYQQAATELTLLHLRAEREGADPAAFARDRDVLLHAMGRARSW
ncbi:MAG: PrsW family intramembrane metalloprotease [Nonomuraea sp.]|nr:PrsW family intramembrane metalloprotease [Nonomuraea sp.]